MQFNNPLVQAAVSVVRNLEVVCYSCVAIALHIIMEISVGACSSVRYWIEVTGPSLGVSVNRENTVCRQSKVDVNRINTQHYSNCLHELKLRLGK